MENGLTDVSALLGGLAAWEQAGYPVESGSTAGTTPAAQPTQAVALTFSPETAAFKGNPAAPVVMVDFSDYQ